MKAFQIKHPDTLPSGTLVYFFDAWEFAIQPISPTDGEGSRTYQPSRTDIQKVEERFGATFFPDRKPEFMVDSLVNHHVVSDFVVRLIATGAGDQARYLMWSSQPDGSESGGVLHDDPSLNPWTRGSEKLNPAYEMTLEQCLGDDKRFFVTFKDAKGKKYYLRSDRTTDPRRNKLGFTPASGLGGGTHPPDRRVKIGNGLSGAHDFFFRIVSSSCTDTLTQSPKAEGEPEIVVNKQPLKVPSEYAGFFEYSNPGASPRDVQAETVSVSHTRTESSTFHWDVGISIESDSEFEIGPVKETIKVTVDTKLGGGTAQTDSTDVKLPIAIPPITVPPHSAVTMHAHVEVRTYTQPFRMRVLRRVKMVGASQADEYELEISGDVSTQELGVATLLWSDPEPYP